MRTRNMVAFFAIVALLGGLLLAHPHFRKTTEAAAQGAPKLKLQYFTVPYNEANLSQVADGFVFPTGGALLTIEGGSLKQGSVELGAGEWVIRARAKSLDSWDVLAIAKADAGSDVFNADTSKALVLKANTLTGQSMTHHLRVDFDGGHGDSDGKTLLSIAFGPRTVEVVFD